MGRIGRKMEEKTETKIERGERGRDEEGKTEEIERQSYKGKEEDKSVCARRVPDVTKSQISQEYFSETHMTKSNIRKVGPIRFLKCIKSTRKSVHDRPLSLPCRGLNLTGTKL